jgi:hypothetical protein
LTDALAAVPFVDDDRVQLRDRSVVLDGEADVDGG